MPPAFRLRSTFPVGLAAVAFASAGSTCSSSTAAEPGPAPSILFIGNGLTAANDLPDMVRRIARADGRTVEVGTVVRPNLAVIDHTTGSSVAPEEIARGSWDIVLLQQGPTPAGICRDTLIIGSLRLAPLIRGAGGRPALWLPWARQSSPASLDPAAESATLAARATGGVVVPIGIAWRDALAADPTLPLYDADEYHPSPAGSLLAALTIYDRLVDRDVRAIGAAAIQPIGGTGLGLTAIERLIGLAHAASASWSADPAQPAPADTTHIATSGGPC